MTFYLFAYPFLWASVLSFGLALCRLKVSKYKLQLVLSIVPLTIMAVIVHYYKQAHWFGLLQPIAMTLCYWRIFRFRLFHAFLVALSVFASGGLSETLLNLFVAGFHLERSLLNQRNVLAIMPVLMTGFHVILYFLLHKFRVGFSFKAPSRLPPIAENEYSCDWLYVSIGFLCILLLLNLAIYFALSLFVPFIILTIVHWVILLYFSYRKEIKD